MSKFSENFRTDDLEQLYSLGLFSGLNEHEIFMFLQFARPHLLEISEGEAAKIPQRFNHMICLVQTGQVVLFTIDYDGNRSMIKYLNKGESSGTLYSMIDYYSSEYEVSAKQDSRVLFIGPEYFFVTDERMATIQHKILVNLMADQRQLFLELSEHMACLSQRTIRDKLLNFLNQCYLKTHSQTLDIPFSREELANYLAVDRASLSRSLSELKSEGIIDYQKNHFVILDRQRLQSNE